MGCGTALTVADTWLIASAMTEISDKAREEIQKAVLRYPNHWTSDRHPYFCAFGVINKETGEWRLNPTKGSACHAALHTVALGPSVVVNAHDPDYQGKHPEFVLWACRESPFAHGVLNKDNEDELLNHASVFDAEEIGRGGCLWLGKALRYCVEDTFRLPFWYKLREQGLDGFQAFVGCSIIDEAGRPLNWTSHNSLFSYGSPESLRENYDEIKNIRRINDSIAARQGKNVGGLVNWGSLKSKKEKRSDGWGGFTEVEVPCDAKEYASKLREIFEGDPKNVK